MPERLRYQDPSGDGGEQEKQRGPLESFWEGLRKKAPMHLLALALTVPMGAPYLRAETAEQEVKIPDTFREAARQISPGSAEDILGKFGEEGLGFLYRYVSEEDSKIEPGLAFKPVDDRVLTSEIRGTYRGKEATIPPDVIGKVLTETLPKGWVEGSISSVSQNRQSTSGTRGGSFVPRTRNIELDGGSEKLSVDLIVDNIVIHESCHGQDWNFNNRLAPQERADILLKIHGRMTSEDAYVPDYNKIVAEDSAYYQASEYWADICSQYFRDLNKLHQKDLELVKGVVDKFDPGFEANQKALERRGLITEVIRRQGLMEDIF